MAVFVYPRIDSPLARNMIDTALPM